VLAGAMDSERISTPAFLITWIPPTLEEVARLFPQYEIFQIIGKGGMGAVYQARQLSLDRIVAIKLLPLEISVNRIFAERFRREARAMGKLSHPNIISVFEFGQTSEGHLFFVMEHVDGAMLHDFIHGSEEPLPPGEALGFIEQICEALAYAHRKGIIHRDIKPTNVMVDRQGRVKVADFGLARIFDAASADQWGKTMSGTIMGTPDYMSPEQKRGMNVDHRADIYALGVVLYEALCRETPQGAFVLPSKRFGLDTRIDEIITRALAPHAEERFQSTVEMRIAIRGGSSHSRTGARQENVCAERGDRPRTHSSTCARDGTTDANAQIENPALRRHRRSCDRRGRSWRSLSRLENQRHKPPPNQPNPSPHHVSAARKIESLPLLELQSPLRPPHPPCQSQSSARANRPLLPTRRTHPRLPPRKSPPPGTSPTPSPPCRSLSEASNA
jgi:serine/threonine protein kinase